MTSTASTTRSISRLLRAPLAVAALVAAAGCHGDSSSGPLNAIDIGQQLTASGSSSLTLDGGASGAQFVLVAYNASPNGDTFASGSIIGNGLATAPSASIVASSAFRTAGGPMLQEGGGARALVPDVAFHQRLQERMWREAPKHFAASRAWFAARQLAGGATSARVGGFGVAASHGAIPANVAVGAVLTLNVNGDSVCNSPIYHGLRVKAVSNKAIVLADTLNPPGGFSDADYQRFATRFDNLIYPLDTQNFGDPSDIDQNGKVAILFTRAVNELTPANSGSFVGGFFFARDLFPATAADPSQACPSSNQGEMFYMLVPDPNGTINGNVHTTGFVDSLTTGILAHEFQHLINAGRRIYINQGATDLEVVWLNEGLSHIAEELLYYAESGKSPRTNLTDADIRVNSRATYPLWKADASQNFSRFIDYLQDPPNHSPVAGNDSLATRGATWSFLRYSVDQVTADEAATWRAFDNSVDTGVKTLNVGLRQDPFPLFRSWALTNYLDDSGFTSDPTYSQKSWNFRDIYTNTYIGLGFPLAVNALVDNTAAAVKVRGLSAAYYRLAVPANQSAHLTFTTSGSGGANLNFIAVRTR